MVVPLLTDELSVSISESLWIINMYPLVMTGLLLGTGTLGDRFGHKLVFQIGMSAFGIASLLAAFSPNAWVLHPQPRPVHPHHHRRRRKRHLHTRADHPHRPRPHQPRRPGARHRRNQTAPPSGGASFEFLILRGS
ncbi:MAG: hypothetical protein E6Y12_04010 [Dermabacter sp.]|nr:hypothetical protein [Dermabacter hominis]MDU4692836.1 hypothetical protein [Dermabacter sp.]